MASCKEWRLADSMKGAGALAGWEGQGGEEERGQLGLSILPYVQGAPFANSRVNKTNIQKSSSFGLSKRR